MSETKKAVIPLLVILILLSSAMLLLITSVLMTATAPSPFLIAATIVSVVALFGAVFSLYVERKAKNKMQQRLLINRMNTPKVEAQ